MLNKEQAGRAVTVENGVRCPNPRICFSEGEAGYLYDKMKGSALFHILVFGSDLRGPIMEGLKAFSAALERGFYAKFGKKEVFNVVLVTKAFPFEVEERMADPQLSGLKEVATVVFDDRPPDEDAHYVWGIDHKKGAVVVVRPDLWVGMSAFPKEAPELEKYFGQFLSVAVVGDKANGITNGVPTDEKMSGAHAGDMVFRYQGAVSTYADTNGAATTPNVNTNGEVINETTNGETNGEAMNRELKPNGLDPDHQHEPNAGRIFHKGTNRDEPKIQFRGDPVESPTNGTTGGTTVDELKKKFEMNGMNGEFTNGEGKKGIPTVESAVPKADVTVERACCR